MKSLIQKTVTDKEDNKNLCRVRRHSFIGLPYYVRTETYNDRYQANRITQVSVTVRILGLPVFSGQYDGLLHSFLNRETF